MVSPLPKLMAFISFYTLISLQHLNVPSFEIFTSRSFLCLQTIPVPLSHYCFFVGFLHRSLFLPSAKCEPFPKFCLSPFLPISIFFLLMREISTPLASMIISMKNSQYLSLALTPFLSFSPEFKTFPQKLGWIYSSPLTQQSNPQVIHKQKFLTAGQNDGYNLEN